MSKVNDKKNLPAPSRQHRYYTPDEVKEHNTANDCYVSIFNEVFDLTNFIQENYSSLMDPLIKSAGSDISHWFDEKTKMPKTCVLEGTSLQCYYTPLGMYPHIPPAYPDADWEYDFDIPWWKNDNFKIGKLTKKVRKIKIMNTLTEHCDLLEVCEEETINEILDRYKKYNDHAVYKKITFQPRQGGRNYMNIERTSEKKSDENQGGSRSTVARYDLMQQEYR